MTDDKKWREEVPQLFKDTHYYFEWNESFPSRLGQKLQVFLRKALAELEAKEAELKEVRAIGSDIADCAKELVDKKEKRIEALKAENEKLRAALRPIAGTSAIGGYAGWVSNEIDRLRAENRRLKSMYEPPQEIPSQFGAQPVPVSKPGEVLLAELDRVTEACTELRAENEKPFCKRCGAGESRANKTAGNPYDLSQVKRKGGA